MFAFHSSDSDEQLSRALQALRMGTPAAEPTSEALERTIAALAEAETRKTPLGHPTWRRRGMVVAGALAATLLLAAFWFDRGGSQVAFGDVLDRIRQARQFSFQAETFRGSPPKSTGKSLLRIAEPDKSRSDWTLPQGNTVLIRNGTRTLLINEARRTVMEQEIPAGAWGGERQALSDLQSAVEKDARALGKKMIDGVMAQGFEAVIHDRKFVVWADAKTGDPVRIECTPLGGVAAKMPIQVLSHFKFGEQFPDELFRFEIPKDYVVTRNEAFQPIEEVKTVLRAYAERQEGRFPARIAHDDAALAGELGLPADRNAGDESQQKLARSLDNVRLLLRSGKPARHYEYLPGARLGDRDRVVFWYADSLVTGTVVPTIPHPGQKVPTEVPEEKQKFKVLFADLHVETRTKAELPGATVDAEAK